MADAEEKYLQEAVRLAELRLNDQIATNSQYERKAVVFTTSSVAVLGYLLGKTQTGESLFFAGAAVFLALSAMCGVAAIWTRKFGAPGQDPEDSWKDAADVVALMIECLGDYQKKIEISAETLRQKEKWLRCSIFLFCIGAATPVVFAVSDMLQKPAA